MWTEQAFLFPAVKQRQDLFGHTVALDGDVGAVSLPNRDAQISGVNPGAVSVFNLQFLHFKWERDVYNVTEGGGVALELVREKYLERLQVLSIESIDRNAESATQYDWSVLYNVARDNVPPLHTVTDLAGAGTAYARAQYYGSVENASVWVDSMYDYRGVSDYLPIAEPLVVYAGRDRVAFDLNATGDAIVEAPDENVTMILRMPGMYASPIGALSSRVDILDDGDGLSPLGLDVCFGKTYATLLEAGDALGGAVASHEADDNGLEDIAVVGAPLADGGLGAAYVLRRERLTGAWEETARLTPPESELAAMNATDADRARAAFGASVAVSRTRGSPSRTTVLVGAPGLTRAFAFAPDATTYAVWSVERDYWNATGAGWELEGVLTAPPNDDGNGLTATGHMHGFATRGALAIDGDLAVVGANGLDEVYVYERTYVPLGVIEGVEHHTRLRWTYNSTNAPRERTGNFTGKWNSTTFAPDGYWVWATVPIVVRSDDYDYDLILGSRVVHKQGFGIALDVSYRTIVVGAPYADYGNRGTSDVEAYDTNGVDNERLGKGKVFAFYSRPAQQILKLRASSALFMGGWKATFTHRNVTCNTTELQYDVAPATLESELERCAAIDDVRVTRSATAVAYHWTVSFVAENAEPPLIEAIWSGRGCFDCTPFSSGYPNNPEEQIKVTVRTTIGGWAQTGAVQAADKHNAELFGAAVAFENDQLIVGAPRSTVAPSTTWDFETGNLVGWSATGDAFDYQPTYGDNTYAREIYGGVGDVRAHGRGQGVRQRGRYWIGTYEMRPGNGDADYTAPSGDYPAGSTQGDTPQGTLTSQPFLVEDSNDSAQDSADTATNVARGAFVSLLVGGGCNALTECVVGRRRPPRGGGLFRLVPLRSSRGGASSCVAKPSLVLLRVMRRSRGRARLVHHYDS